MNGQNNRFAAALVAHHVKGIDFVFRDKRKALARVKRTGPVGQLQTGSKMRADGIHKADAGLGIGIKPEIGLGQLVIHSLSHGIEFFRPVNFDVLDMLFGLDVDRHLVIPRTIFAGREYKERGRACQRNNPNTAFSPGGGTAPRSAPPAAFFYLNATGWPAGRQRFRRHREHRAGRSHGSTGFPGNTFAPRAWPDCSR